MERIYLIENVINGRLFAKVISNKESLNLLNNQYIQKNGYKVIDSADYNRNEAQCTVIDKNGNSLPKIFEKYIK